MINDKILLRKKLSFWAFLAPNLRDQSYFWYQIKGLVNINIFCSTSVQELLTVQVISETLCFRGRTLKLLNRATNQKFCLKHNSEQFFLFIAFQRVDLSYCVLVASSIVRNLLMYSFSLLYLCEYFLCKITMNQTTLKWWTFQRAPLMLFKRILLWPWPINWNFSSWHRTSRSISFPLTYRHFVQSDQD